MALCMQEQTGYSWAEALTSQQQYHKSVKAMKRRQQLILSLAKLERDAFPSSL